MYRYYHNISRGGETVTLARIIDMMTRILAVGWYPQSALVGKASVDLTDAEDAQSRETALGILEPMLEACPDKALPVPGLPESGHLIVPVGGLGEDAEPPKGKGAQVVTCADALDYLREADEDPDSIDHTVGAGRTRGLALDLLSALGVEVEGVRFESCESLVDANLAEAAANRAVTLTTKAQDVAAAAEWLRDHPGAGYTALGRAVRSKNKGAAQRLHSRASLVAVHGVSVEEAMKVAPAVAARLAKLSADAFPAEWENVPRSGDKTQALTTGQIKSALERANDALAPIRDMIAGGDKAGLARLAGMTSDDCLALLASLAAEARAKRERTAQEKAQAGQ